MACAVDRRHTPPTPVLWESLSEDDDVTSRTNEEEMSVMGGIAITATKARSHSSASSSASSEASSPSAARRVVRSTAEDDDDDEHHVVVEEEDALEEEVDDDDESTEEARGPSSTRQARAPTQRGRKRSMTKERASGRWTRAEHEEFLRCLEIYGREWKKVSQKITTRTAAQIRSHAQKYFKKIQTADKPPPEPQPPKKAPHKYPTRAEAVAAVDDFMRNLRAKRDRCSQREERASKKPRVSSDMTPFSKNSWRRRASEPNLAAAEHAERRLRRRVVSCEDLGASELIALEMLCARTTFS
mmetsp:Transcript_26741/g.82105  ORF Transcript_26741/g.82105 Transcript_26741/m.82105 type:complete len:300 (+) Transcript_26741:194-1093(+)